MVRSMLLLCHEEKIEYFAREVTEKMEKHIFRLPGNSEWIDFGGGIKKIACE